MFGDECSLVLTEGDKDRPKSGVDPQSAEGEPLYTCSRSLQDRVSSLDCCQNLLLLFSGNSGVDSVFGYSSTTSMKVVLSGLLGAKRHGQSGICLPPPTNCSPSYPVSYLDADCDDDADE